MSLQRGNCITNIYILEIQHCFTSGIFQAITILVICIPWMLDGAELLIFPLADRSGWWALMFSHWSWAPRFGSLFNASVVVLPSVRTFSPNQDTSGLCFLSQKTLSVTHLKCFEIVKLVLTPCFTITGRELKLTTIKLPLLDWKVCTVSVLL